MRNEIVRARSIVGDQGPRPSFRTDGAVPLWLITAGGPASEPMVLACAFRCG